MKFPIAMIALVIIAVQLSEACETGERVCSPDGSAVWLCFNNAWATRFAICKQGCAIHNGIAVCRERIANGCCRPTLFASWRNCYHSTNGCGIFSSYSQQSCYDIEECTSTHRTELSVNIENIASYRYKFTIDYDRELTVVLNTKSGEFVVPCSVMPNSSNVCITPELAPGVYRIRIFEGLRELYASQLKVERENKANTVEFVTYTVKPGDTLSKIAAAYGLEAELLAELNNIENPNFIRVGQQLSVPIADIHALIDSEADSLQTETICQERFGEFNPNNIISDKEFLNYLSVSQTELENYFRNRGLWCAGYRLSDGTLLSEKIVQEATKRKINPLLILARIQTEQSAIEQQPNYKQLQGLTGCRLSEPEWQGATRQIECAAERYMRWFQAKYLYDYLSLPIPKIEVSNLGASAYVYPENAATFSLYKYTPHIKVTPNGGGNYLFFNIYKHYREELCS